jgi:lysozyme
MHISSGALAFVEREEGYVGIPYRDVAGVWTIGYGHTGPDVFRIGHLTQPQAAALLRRDFAEHYEPPVQDLIRRGAHPSQGIFDALCDMSYNCGAGSVDASSTIGRLMIAGHTSAVPAHILQWDKARVGGRLVVVEGLRERRLADVAMFVSDVGAAAARGVRASVSA